MNIIITMCYILSIIGKAKKSPIKDIAIFVIQVLGIELNENNEVVYDAVLNVVFDLFPEEECNEIIKPTGLFKILKDQYKNILTYVCCYTLNDNITNYLGHGSLERRWHIIGRHDEQLGNVHEI